MRKGLATDGLGGISCRYPSASADTSLAGGGKGVWDET